MGNSANRFVNLNGAAKILGVTRQRVGELRDAGRFPAPATEMNGRGLWTVESVEKFRKQREQEAKRAAKKRENGK